MQKYDKVPDDFIDFKSQLHTDFAYLKEATSKNIENLQQALNLQQTSAFCGHINLIYSKLAKLEDQLEKLQRQSNTEFDYVELNTPDFDPGINVIPVQNSHRVEVSVRDIPTPSDSTNTDATGQAQNSKGRDQQTTNPILPQNPHQSLHSPTRLQKT